MRVRTFKNQFEPSITRKVNPKRQTIRPFPKRMPKAGDLESWRVWTGRPYNSPQRELVQVRLVSIRYVQICYEFIAVNGEILLPREKKALARRDGFDGILPLLDWFDKTHGLPFAGILIEAEDI